MFTFLFGLIKGFFKLIGGAITFIIGTVVLIVICVCFARACGNFAYEAYQMEKDVPHTTEHHCPQTDYYQQNNIYYPPQTQNNTTYKYPNPPQPVYDPTTRSGYNENASYMFKNYHYIHQPQFGPGVYVSCPVCHRHFYKNSVDNCFCTDDCWRRYNDIVNAWNRNDRYGVERLGKRYDKYDY